MTAAAPRYVPIPAFDRPGWFRLQDATTGKVEFGVYASANAARVIGNWLSGAPRPLPKPKTKSQ